MIKRRSHIHHKPISSIPASALSTLSFSWIPLTLILLLYTSGLCIGETTKSEDADKVPDAVVGDGIINKTSTTKLGYNKTGNPQIDWEFDPNLPRELNGRNLSDYPFFSRVPPPDAINFSCDGLKDGFYASIEYKCQVYHHCLFGTRYDFLCGNYTAFDQKTFICQFVSEVDCPNSALFFNKNDDLYWTTTEAPPRSRESSKRLRPAVQTYFPRRSGASKDEASGTADNASPAAPTPPAYNDEYRRQNQPKAVGYNDEYRKQNQPSIYGTKQDQTDESEEEYAEPPRRRKPSRDRRRCKKGRCRGRNRPRARPRPAYYDYDDEYYEDDDYDDYENEYYDERPNKRRREKPKAGRGRKVAGSKRVESLTSTAKIPSTEVTPSTTVSTTEAPVALQAESVPSEPIDSDNAGKTREEIFTKSRPPPRIRPPVPKHERNYYGAMQGRAPVSTQSPTTAVPQVPVVKAVEEDEYYDDDYQQPIQQSSTSKPSTSKPRPSTTGAPTTLSSRQKFVNRNLRTTSTTPGSTTQTTTVRTTPSTTTTAPTTRAATQQSTSTAATTTTTTEAPQYDYEYEYEDELPPTLSTERSSTASPTTTTTTTTTTQKPSRNNFRGNKRPSSLSSIQTSTSVTVNEQDLEDVQIPLEPADASQNSINRRRSSWTRNQPSKTSAASETTPNSISSTSERFQTKSIQRSSQPTYQEPVITVKSAPTPQQPLSKATEPPTSRIRPSRFWQRPAKVVASTITPISTTEAPVDYADYQDEPETSSVPATRYNSQKIGSSSSSSSSVAYKSPQVSGNSEEPYGQQPQYGRTGHQYTSNNNQQFLRQSQTPYRQPPQTPARVTLDPNNYVSPYSSVSMTSSMRPEFISLLRDDEGPYYDDPQQTQLQTPRNAYSSSSSSSTRRLPPQRPQYFGNQPYHQTQKNLYGAAQESYPTFVNPPPRFNTNAFMNEFRYHPMMFALRN